MTVLSANKQIELIYVEPIGATMTWKGYTTADEYYQGAMLTWNSKTGYVQPAGTIGEGEVFVGFCTNRLTSTAAQFPEIAVDPGGAVLKSRAVTGVTGVTDIGKLVYITDDNIDTATLTRAATDCIPIGKVIRHRSSTTCDILTFTFREAIAFMFNGAGRQTHFVGSTDLNTVTNADVLTNCLTFHGTGKIVGFYLMVDTVTTDNDAAALFNLEINTTDVTGGVITIDDTAGSVDIDVKGARVDSSAITAANLFYPGDTLSIEAASVTDYTDGVVSFFIVTEGGI